MRTIITRYDGMYETAKALLNRAVQAMKEEAITDYFPDYFGDNFDEAFDGDLFDGNGDTAFAWIAENYYGIRRMLERNDGYASILPLADIFSKPAKVASLIVRLAAMEIVKKSGLADGESHSRGKIYQAIDDASFDLGIGL